MSEYGPYTRRIFVKSVLGAIVVGPAVLTSACQDGDAVDRRLEFHSLREAMDEAEILAQAASVRSESIWTLSQTLIHCAQSIEYSIIGFPQMKSAVFQNTVGSAAFDFFAWRGRMSHDLAEPIPGAPALDADTNLSVALARLRKSVVDFESSSEPLQPHFAFGQLSKSDYELAHVMHLANHFSMMDA